MADRKMPLEQAEQPTFSVANTQMFLSVILLSFALDERCLSQVLPDEPYYSTTHRVALPSTRVHEWCRANVLYSPRPKFAVFARLDRTAVPAKTTSTPLETSRQLRPRQALKSEIPGSTDPRGGASCKALCGKRLRATGRKHSPNPSTGGGIAAI